MERLEPKIEGELDERSDVSGTVAIARGARVISSRLIGPLVIGADSMIEDSAVGPYASIGEGVGIRKSGVSDSIVMEGLGELKSSLIGRDAEIKPDTGSPDFHSSYSFILGDNSRMRLAAVGGKVSLAPLELR